MGKLRDLSNSLNKLSRSEIELNIREVVKDHEPELVDYNTAQLMEGKDSAGDVIDPDYAAFTIEKKRREGKPTDRVQLLDDGDFHRGFFIKADRFPVRFTSSDEKTKKLTKRYGKEIFGLTRQNLTGFSQDYFKEALQKVYRKFLQL